MNIVQVAGIIDAEEACMLLDCGVDWLGFPLGLDVHDEDLTEVDASRIIGDLHIEERAVLITYLDTPHDIIALCESLAVRSVQLHGDIAPASLRRLREAVPGLRIIKSIVVGVDPPAVYAERARKWMPWVDAFITDTHDPATGAMGATGKTHDWDVSRSLAASCGRPLILAGGLGPDNVESGIGQVRPFGVDAHTRLEDGSGRKDRILVESFVRAARRGFDALGGYE